MLSLICVWRHTTLYIIVRHLVPDQIHSKKWEQLEYTPLSFYEIKLGHHFLLVLLPVHPSITSSHQNQFLMKIEYHQKWEIVGSLLLNRKTYVVPILVQMLNILQYPTSVLLFQRRLNRIYFFSLCLW